MLHKYTLTSRIGISDMLYYSIENAESIEQAIEIVKSRYHDIEVLDAFICEPYTLERMIVYRDATLQVIYDSDLMFYYPMIRENAILKPGEKNISLCTR
jgi:hypothetical protein